MSLRAVFSQNILVRWLTGRSAATDLAVTMSGVRLGERLLQVGLGDGRLLVALAAKVGMSGRTCGLDERADAVTRAEAAAAREGVLVELQQARCDALPFAAGDFDAVVVNAAPPAPVDAGAALFREAERVLRPGGRCVVVTKGARRGGALGSEDRGIGRHPNHVVAEMRAAGFRAARVLAEREGLAFAEGVKSAE